MKELVDCYKSRKNNLLLVSVSCWFILTIIFFILSEEISNCLSNYATNSSIKWVTESNEMLLQLLFTLLLDLIAPATIVFIPYFFYIDYFNKEGWKKKFPQYDVSGEWLDTTTYMKGLDGNGWSTSNRINVPSPVRIEQTCQTVKVLPSIGDDFEWHSLLAGWDENDNLRILYKVEYYENLQENQGYPESRTGYESMHICPNDNKRPCKMVGKFWHCIRSDGKPMYMGDVTYERQL